MPLSESPKLRIAAALISAMPLGFGINALLRPANVVEYLGFQVPQAVSDRNVVDGLVYFYGARDIYMSAAMFAAAYYGHRKTLGWMLVVIAGVAGVDGWVVNKFVGHGMWNHWGYMPMVFGLGASLLGCFDSIV